MASPQRENGHLDIANELVEVLIKTDLNGGEFRLLLLVLRKTWAWGKFDDWISITQMQKMTGFSRQYICKLRKALVNKNILLLKGNKVKFNKDYDTWVVNNSLLVNNRRQVVNNRRQGSQHIVGTQKKLLQKKLNTKENMKNKLYFLNQRRAEQGKPPMQYKFTGKQIDFFDGSKLIPIFKKAVIDFHKLSYWEHPDDIADLEKENSRINGQIKIFWKRCDKDLKKATEVIEWYAKDYGKWKNWSPGFCFRKDTVVDFENKGKEKGGGYYEI